MERPLIADVPGVREVAIRTPRRCEAPDARRTDRSGICEIADVDRHQLRLRGRVQLRGSADTPGRCDDLPAVWRPAGVGFVDTSGLGDVHERAGRRVGHADVVARLLETGEGDHSVDGGDWKHLLGSVGRGAGHIVDGHDDTYNQRRCDKRRQMSDPQSHVSSASCSSRRRTWIAGGWWR